MKFSIATKTEQIYWCESCYIGRTIDKEPVCRHCLQPTITALLILIDPTILVEDKDVDIESGRGIVGEPNGQPR